MPDYAPVLEHAQLRALLPQRYPMLLLDRVLHVEPGRSITAVKAVTGAEPCYRDLPDDAGPDRYRYPASLLVESFGQAAAVMWLLSSHELDAPGHLPLLAAVRDVWIEADAYPGDVLRHEVRLDHAIDGAAFATGSVFVNSRRIAAIGSLLAVVRPSALLGAAPTRVPIPLIHS
jgi:3-hydroxyacyl-[acyl-carrier-protein] dehydratase